jgi:hypothetical protein
MHKRQVAAYVACLTVFVACVAEAYDALFPSPSMAPQEATVGLANDAAPWRSDASESAVPPFSVTRLHQDVSVTPDPAAEQGPSLAAGRADNNLTSADRQEREENSGERHRNVYQVRTVHRGEYYSYRRRNADERSFFGRERYGTYASRNYEHRDRYYDNYARRDSSAFVRGDRDRDRFSFGHLTRDEKNSRSRQSRGVFGTFVWH